MKLQGLDSSERHVLVHWCHGAPGAVYLFSKAYEVNAVQVISCAHVCMFSFLKHAAAIIRPYLAITEAIGVQDSYQTSATALLLSFVHMKFMQCLRFCCARYLVMKHTCKQL